MSRRIRNTLKYIGLLSAAITAGAGFWLSQPGPVTVIDGDTIKIDGQSYRLAAIDAPELSQTCRDAGGRDYACGKEAANHLRDLIGRKMVACQEVSRDRYRRIIGKCSLQTDAGPVDLSAYMVRAGWAVTYDRYGGQVFAADQAAAKAAKRGLWSGTFDPPADYRRLHPVSLSTH